MMQKPLRSVVGAITRAIQNTPNSVAYIIVARTFAEKCQFSIPAKIDGYNRSLGKG